MSQQVPSDMSAELTLSCGTKRPLMDHVTSNSQKTPRVAGAYDWIYYPEKYLVKQAEAYILSNMPLHLRFN